MPFVEGDPAILIDSKGREFLLKLEAGRTFQFHRGTVPHDDLIGQPDGTWIDSSGGASMLLIRPRLSDFVIRMKRGAQVVYPKDVGPIFVYADIAPGQTILEAGTGSGALTIALTRAVGDTGRVISVERREDHAEHATKTIRRWFGQVPPQLDLRTGDVTQVLESEVVDRLVLDLPEPWHPIGAAASSQAAGLLIAAYVPTIPQVQQTVEAARAAGVFTNPEVKEILIRDWNIDGRSVRPEQRMVGHTGFLIFMRKTADKPGKSNPEK